MTFFSDEMDSEVVEDEEAFMDRKLPENQVDTSDEKLLLIASLASTGVSRKLSMWLGLALELLAYIIILFVVRWSYFGIVLETEWQDFWLFDTAAWGWEEVDCDPELPCPVYQVHHTRKYKLNPNPNLNLTFVVLGPEVLATIHTTRPGFFASILLTPPAMAIYTLLSAFNAGNGLGHSLLLATRACYQEASSCSMKSLTLTLVFNEKPNPNPRIQ